MAEQQKTPESAGKRPPRSEEEWALIRANTERKQVREGFRSSLKQVEVVLKKEGQEGAAQLLYGVALDMHKPDSRLVGDKVLHFQEAVQVAGTVPALAGSPVLAKLQEQGAIMQEPTPYEKSNRINHQSKNPITTMEQQTPTDGVKPKAQEETPAQKNDSQTQQARVDFNANAQPVADALRKAGKDTEAQQLEEASKIIAPAGEPKKVAPAATKPQMSEEREEFVKNAQPVADALRKSGKEDEAKQLEAAAKYIGGDQQQQQRIAQPAEGHKPGTLKDVLDNIWNVIDQDPNLKNMEQAKNLRNASKKLEGAGILDVRVQDGLVTPFLSNFAANFAQQAHMPEKQEKQKVTLESKPKEGPELPGAAGQTVNPTQAKPDATVATEAKISTGTPADGTSVQTRDSSGQEVKTSVASGDAARGVVAQAVTDAKVTAETQQPAATAAKLDSPASSKPTQTPEQTPAASVAQNATEKSAPALQFTQYAPTPDTGVIENRKTVSNPMDALNVGITADGRFGVNPQVNQARLIGDGMKSLEKFFDYEMPTSGHKIAKVGLAELGQMKQTAEGWEVAKKGQLELTDTAGNVFRPALKPEVQAQQVAPAQQEAPAQQVTPTQQPSKMQGKSFTSDDVPFAALAALGMKQDDLVKSGQMQALLDGRKTELLPTFSTNNAAGESVPFTARLQLVRDEKGVVDLRVETPKHQLEIPKQILGNDITPAMKEQLEQRGVVPLATLKNAQGEPFKGWIAVDKEMKTVVTVREENVVPVKQIMGLDLNAAQQRRLFSGEPTRLEGLKRGEADMISATAQLDPVKRSITFSKAEPYAVKQKEEMVVAAPKSALKIG